MCYCEKCGRYFDRPRLGPRKVLEEGFFTPTVYDLDVYISHFEYEDYVGFYFYKRDLFCPKCGRKYEEMDSYWATELGEHAPDSVITRYFRYCQTHPDTVPPRYPGLNYGYPGSPC